MKAEEMPSKTEVKVLQIPFRFNYQFGSLDSVKFLDHYSESKTEEFILSDWKHVVELKWRNSKVLLTLLALLYWCLMISCTLSVIFLPESDVVKKVTVCLVLVILLYELLQITAYSGYKISK